MADGRPDVLFVMTDQQRFDTIAALGNRNIHTPSLDRLVARGIAFTNAYSCCPVCVPARYTIRSGCESASTGVYANTAWAGMHDDIERACGLYLASTMGALGYRTFGVGKFHTYPWDADVGFDVHLRSEELYATADQRARDAYAAWIASEHPHFDWIEALMGERTEMYYVPQMSLLPAALTVESWAADRAIELIGADASRPWFGFISFIGPHPPLAPPLPWNRMYDPDRMPDPVVGDPEVDHRDEQLPYMNYAVYAEDISPSLARVLKARYYGEISYIDHCLGRVLDALDRNGRAENTLICFFADHGDHLGDHRAWQKEGYFEASCRVPFLLSWPARLAAGVRRADLVSLADLFGIATAAAGAPELREGVDVLGTLVERAEPRSELFGFYGVPGTASFKVMLRQGVWKYVFMANGAREQLFDLASDPGELTELSATRKDVRDRLRGLCASRMAQGPAAGPGGSAGGGLRKALASDGDLLEHPFEPLPRVRIRQFDASRGVVGFPAVPGDLQPG